MYRGLAQAPGQQRTNATSFMASKGMNTRFFSQLLDLKFCTLMRNYIPYGDGDVRKRAGQRTLIDQGGTEGVELFEEYTNDILIFGYGGTVYSYEISTGTVETIVSGLSANGNLDGTRYGDYFFIVNGVDPLKRVFREMDFTIDVQNPVANRFGYGLSSAGTPFTNGQVITGATSGATATITSIQTNSSTSGVLRVNVTSGTFLDGENITDPITGDSTITWINRIEEGQEITGQNSGAKAVVLEGTGSTTMVLGNVRGTFEVGEDVLTDETVPGRATVDSVIRWDDADISSAPIGDIVEAIVIDKGGRLAIGGIKDQPGRVQVSDVDDGDNPPFGGWSDSTTVEDGFIYDFRRAGKTRSILTYGSDCVVMCEFGYFAFAVEQLDIGGTLAKKIVNRGQVIDEGGERNAVNTKKGILSVSEAGLRQLVQLGQKNIPITEQSIDITQSLADDYFANIDFTNADLVYDKRNQIVYATCRRDSDVNNLIIGYSFEQEAIFEITGWNISRLINVDQTIYGADAVTGKIYKLFTGNSDDGSVIPARYEQELRFSDLTSRVDLMEMYLNGQLSDESSIDVYIDRFDRTGAYKRGAWSGTWTRKNPIVGSGQKGYNNSYTGGYGSGNAGNLTNQQGGFKPKVRRANRIILRISSGDLYPHIINYVQAWANVTTYNRNRSITKN